MLDGIRPLDLCPHVGQTYALLEEFYNGICPSLVGLCLHGLCKVVYLRYGLQLAFLGLHDKCLSATIVCCGL